MNFNSLKEFSAAVNAYIKDRVKRDAEEDREINNLKVILMAAQDKINDQNIENNTLRKRYYEALRTIQEYKKGV